jgi:hypothetical protein
VPHPVMFLLQYARCYSHLCLMLRTFCCRFVISGWLLVVITFVLCGVFVILNK